MDDSRSLEALSTPILGKSTIPCPLAHTPQIILQRSSMTSSRFKSLFFLSGSVLLLASIALAFQASAIPSAQLINPEDLVKTLKSQSEKPLMLQVGSHVLYAEAHIPESEYVGPASTDAGLQQLRKRVASLPHNKFILLYCGCCPWNHCPNVKPAADALRSLGFTNVKVLFIANNFGTDWVDKGYPVAKGE